MITSYISLSMFFVPKVFEVIINGKPYNPFVPERGLRQGNSQFSFFVSFYGSILDHTKQKERREYMELW